MKKRKSPSLSQKLTQRIMIALALMLVVINGVIYYLIDASMSHMIENTFRGMLEVESQSLRMLLKEVETATSNSIDEVETQIEDPEKISEALAQALLTNPKIRGFFVAFKPDFFPDKGRWFEPYAVWRNGHIEKMQVGSAQHDYLKNEWYQEGIRAKNGYWSEPYYDKDGAKEMLCTYVQPFFDRQGNRVGVFGADVSLEWVHNKLRKQDLKTNQQRFGLDIEKATKEGSYTFVIDHKGTYISHPDKSYVLNRNLFDDIKQTEDQDDDLLMEEMAAKQVGYKKLTIHGQKAYVFYTPVKKTGWTLGFVVPKAVKELPSFLVSVIILIMMGLGLFLVYLICRITIRQLNITTSEKMQMESELNFASGIQMSMLPNNFPQRDDVNIYGYLKPAKAVGGDLFDFFIRDEKLFFCIGDVLGKGVSAAMLMTVTKSLFRAYTANEDSPETIITRINKTMSENNDAQMFVTLFVGVLHLPSGQLQYCSAGHEPPILINNDVSVLPFEPAFPVGSFDDTVYKNKEIRIKPNELLFLFTDGLNEAEDEFKEMFEKERIVDVMHDAMAKGDVWPESLIQRMTEAVDDFVGDAVQSDDLTMLAIKRLMPDTITLKASESSYTNMTDYLLAKAEKAHFDKHQAGRLRLAVEEAVGNIIDYSGATELTLSADFSDGQLSITITDDGKPFNPLTAPEPELDVPIEDRKIGGLGILYMRKMSDSLTYQRTGHQNILNIKMKAVPF